MNATLLLYLPFRSHCFLLKFLSWFLHWWTVAHRTTTKLYQTPAGISRLSNCSVVMTSWWANFPSPSTVTKLLDYIILLRQNDEQQRWRWFFLCQITIFLLYSSLFSCRKFPELLIDQSCIKVVRGLNEVGKIWFQVNTKCLWKTL